MVDKRGKDVVIVKDIRKLEPVLGKNWNFRVINANVDFDYVAEDTEASVCFWLGLLGGLSFMRVGLNKNHYLSSPLL